MLNRLNELPTEYDFKDYPLILLGYGGSISYGTNTPASDIDIRGVFENSVSELIGTANDRESVVFSSTDTTLYTLKKAMLLFSQCNPNTIELLGLKPEHYFYISDIGQELLDNKEIFLSKRAAFTFGSYAKSQLNRLTNKAVHDETDILNNKARSLEKVVEQFVSKYNLSSGIRVENGDVKIDLNAKDLSIKEIHDILNALQNVQRDYQKSKRNEYATEHGRLSKHQMHLLRLYIMGIDILNGEIITYREKEHDLLMSVRAGDFLKDDKPTPEFNSLLVDYEKKFNLAVEKSLLPEQADKDKINELAIKLNKQILQRG